jgi:peptidyl-prolyl cis-trans isomerase D
MTMLDRMRRHKGWLKWSLALVCLTFVIFYIPDFLRGPDDTVPGDRVASVGERAITLADFRQRYQQQIDAYRTAYGGTLTEEAIRQLQIGQMVLQQMIEENAELAEAARLGLTVTDEEVRARILAIPALQEDGRFIGEQRYRELLQMQRPAVSPAEFEENLRRTLVIEKLRTGLTEWMSISDAELEKEYARRNSKVKLEVVSIAAADFRKDVTVADPDVATYFDANKERYRQPERRTIRFVLLDADQARAKLEVPRAEVERYYTDHVSDFTTPERIRASHILFKTDGKTDADVQAKAEAVLKQARAGADFAELARKHSQDDANAKDGGDLDYFGRGTMVTEFESAAFALQPGQISDLVKTAYGFHIIKLTDRRPEIKRTLAEPELYRQIVDIVGQDLAARQIADLADTVVREAVTPAALDKVAAAHGLKAEDSAPFGRGEAIGRLGVQPAVNSQAFELAENVMAGPVPVPAGRIVFYVSGRQDSRIPALDEVRARVRDDAVQARALDLARKKAEQVAASLKSAPDFQKAAKAAGFETTTTDPLTREAVIPGVGLNPDIDAVAFTLPIGGVSGAVSTPQGAAIVKVLERQNTTAADFAAARDTFRDGLLGERRTRFFSAYMERVRGRMRIEIDAEGLKRVLG